MTQRGIRWNGHEQGRVPLLLCFSGALVLHVPGMFLALRISAQTMEAALTAFLSPASASFRGLLLLAGHALSWLLWYAVASRNRVGFAAACFGIARKCLRDGFCIAFLFRLQAWVDLSFSLFVACLRALFLCIWIARAIPCAWKRQLPPPKSCVLQPCVILFLELVMLSLTWT